MGIWLEGIGELLQVRLGRVLGPCGTTSTSIKHLQPFTRVRLEIVVVHAHTSFFRANQTMALLFEVAKSVKFCLFFHAYSCTWQPRT